LSEKKGLDKECALKLKIRFIYITPAFIWSRMSRRKPVSWLLTI